MGNPAVADSPVGVAGGAWVSVGGGGGGGHCGGCEGGRNGERVEEGVGGGDWCETGVSHLTPTNSGWGMVIGAIDLSCSCHGWGW